MNHVFHQHKYYCKDLKIIFVSDYINQFNNVINDIISDNSGNDNSKKEEIKVDEIKKKYY
jgi:hypothetical protein